MMQVLIDMSSLSGEGGGRGGVAGMEVWITVKMHWLFVRQKVVWIVVTKC